MNVLFGCSGIHYWLLLKSWIKLYKCVKEFFPMVRLISRSCYLLFPHHKSFVSSSFFIIYLACISCPPSSLMSLSSLVLSISSVISCVAIICHLAFLSLSSCHVFSYKCLPLSYPFPSFVNSIDCHLACHLHDHHYVICHHNLLHSRCGHYALS